MTIATRSVFYYMDNIELSTSYVDFKEDGAAMEAQLVTGAYSLGDFATELTRVMTAKSELSGNGWTYTPTVNRTTRKLTISAVGGESNTAQTFSLLTQSGSHAGSSALIVAGFSGTDKTGATSYEGSSGIGNEYKPQFLLQKYIPSENYQERLSPSVNQSASGKVEVLSFGIVPYIQMEIPFCTDINQGTEGIIENNATGVADVIAFLKAITAKINFEFIPDVDSRGTYQKVLLESAPGSSKGVGYKLKEMLPLNGYFTTGKLKLRVIT